MAKITFVYPDFENLGIEYLMAVCLRNGHEVDFVYYQAEDTYLGRKIKNISFQKIAKKVAKTQPHIAACAPLYEANQRLERMLSSNTPSKLVAEARAQLEARLRECFAELLNPGHLLFNERQAFSARAVIAPGAELRLDQVGLPEEIAWSLFSPLVQRQIGDVEEVDRRSQQARQTLEELLEIATPCGARLHTGLAHLFLAEIDLETSPDEAASHFHKSSAILQEIKAENFLALAYAGMGRLNRQQGNVAQAREYLSKALEIFERLGTLVEPDKVRAELVALPEKE